MLVVEATYSPIVVHVRQFVAKRLDVVSSELLNTVVEDLEVNRADSSLAGALRNQEKIRRVSDIKKRGPLFDDQIMTITKCSHQA